MKHGTSGYKNGCRCDVCVETTRTYKRNWKRRQAEKRKRWSVEPLRALVPDMKERLGLDDNAWRAANSNGLTDEQADQWAARLGWPSGYVWPDWYARGLRVIDDLFVNGTDGAEPGWRQAAYPEAS